MVHRQLTLCEFFYWAIGLRRRFRIAGSSMTPTFSPGEEVLVNPRAYRTRGPLPGEVVLAKHPFHPTLIVKRVARLEPSGSCFLVGDNRAESTDSESFGAVATSRIVGRVVSTFSRP